MKIPIFPHHSLLPSPSFSISFQEGVGLHVSHPPPPFESQKNVSVFRWCSIIPTQWVSSGRLKRLGITFHRGPPLHTIMSRVSDSHFKILTKSPPLQALNVKKQFTLKGLRDSAWGEWLFPINQMKMKKTHAALLFMGVKGKKRHTHTDTKTDGCRILNSFSNEFQEEGWWRHSGAARETGWSGSYPYTEPKAHNLCVLILPSFAVWFVLSGCEMKMGDAGNALHLPLIGNNQFSMRRQRHPSEMQNESRRRGAPCRAGRVGRLYNICILT